MSNPYFKFRQFTIRHDKCAMKVGTDGVLLGAWTHTENASFILDTGTGTGLIAIMLAQRSTALIDAVEIDQEACKQAQDNISNCLWKDRINLYPGAIQGFEAGSGGLYDVIVSNPPFFRNSLKSPDTARSAARHGDILTYEDLLISSARMLAQDGRLNVILPASEREYFTNLAYIKGLYPSRTMLVRPTPEKEFSRCLAEFVRDRYHPCIQNEMTIRQGSGYSEDYIVLTKDYYLSPRHEWRGN